MHITELQMTVGLYLQSETLWFLPPLKSSLLPPEALQLQTPTAIPQPFVLGTDDNVLPHWRPGRGAGAFSKTLKHPVIVPKSHILLEAFLRLFARDWQKPQGSFAISMVSYMEEYVDDEGLLDATLLPEPLQKFYSELRTVRKPLRQWALELSDALGYSHGE